MEISILTPGLALKVGSSAWSQMVLLRVGGWAGEGIELGGGSGSSGLGDTCIAGDSWDVVWLELAAAIDRDHVGNTVGLPLSSFNTWWWVQHFL